MSKGNQLAIFFSISTAFKYLREGKLEMCWAYVMEHLSGDISSTTYVQQIQTMQAQNERVHQQFYSNHIGEDTFRVQEAKLIHRTSSLLQELKQSAPTIGSDDSPYQLAGVWQSIHTNGEHYYWVLLPNGQCIVNHQIKEGLLESKQYRWQYDKDSQIVTQYTDKTSINGLVEWISPHQFKVTVLDIFAQVMVYQKVL